MNYDDLEIESIGTTEEGLNFIIGLNKHGIRYGAICVPSYHRKGKESTKDEFINIHGNEVIFSPDIGYYPRMGYSFDWAKDKLNWFCIHTNHRGDLPDYDKAKEYFGSNFEPKLRDGVLVTDGHLRDVFFILKHLKKMSKQISNKQERLIYE